ncbi:MAG: integration host factor subunit beta [Deltaproteobacteria bacterium]|nr:integration host factor subunit beta [Deltaproteobacteria bacterium]MBW2053744.1 integration host factor subunit beta [Deltaproteobacteria bacterium]MBW2140757.1 integration host factor subunit beta [Deltaproteobacteria bacterium]MBW2324612.1 integration host factor subunit beta [Deltaproteobacteria bacterium]
MNKSQLIEELAMREGLSLKDAEAVLNVFFESITDGLVKGDRAEIRGFGSFKTKSYDGYQGRNPKSGQPIQVQPKKLPFFKVGKELRALVDNDTEN